MRILNATYLAPDGAWQQGELTVRDGRILRSAVPLPDEPEFDAQGLRVIPGLIDSHTHFREPGQRRQEGIANGSRAALKGGVTTVLDMPNNRPPITTKLRLENKRRLFATRCRTNWGLHLHAPGGSRVPPLPKHCASVKVYMAQSSSNRPVLHLGRLARLFAAYPVVVLHAEDEARFLPERLPHHRARPRAAVRSALDLVERALATLPRRQQPRLVLAHAATRDEVDWVRRMKHNGVDLWAETCPHYWLLTHVDCDRVGAKLQVNPPLRSPADREAILHGLADGTIDFVSTDHAPHTLARKGGLQPPSGIPGIEWLAPAVVGLVRKGIIDWHRFLDLTCVSSARCFGIVDRNGIREGNHADLTFLAEGIPDGEIVTRAGYAPFAGKLPDIRVHAVMVAGLFKYLDREFLNQVPGKEVI